MTFLATWPTSTGHPAGCDDFDTERQALAWAQRLTARGVAHVVVYEVSDAALEAPWGAADHQADPIHTHDAVRPSDRRNQ